MKHSHCACKKDSNFNGDKLVVGVFRVLKRSEKERESMKEKTREIES